MMKTNVLNKINQRIEFQFIEYTTTLIQRLYLKICCAHAFEWQEMGILDFKNILSLLEKNLLGNDFS